MTDSQDARDDYLDRLVTSQRSVTENTAQEVIVVTRDKVELALRRNLPRYVDISQVVTSAGLFIGLLTTLVSAEFQDFAGLKAGVWSGIFIAGCLLALIIFVRDLVRILRRPKLEDLVEAIARSTTSS